MLASSRLIAVLSVFVLSLVTGSGCARGQSCAANSGSIDEPCAPVANFAGAPAADPSSAATPEGGGGAKEKWDTAPAGTSHQAPFSRIGIGANVSPLGIGINGTTVLSDYFDLRLMGNYFNFTSTQFEIEGFRATADLHLASMAASLDLYPFNSVWRLSPGVMFFNGNQLTANAMVNGGTSFSLDGNTFYSATSNSAAGATPMTGTGILGMHPRPIAFTAAGGFGKFVPRSERHWSFPAEFGVVFMGAPTANVTTSGWVCTDKAQMNCASIGDTSNPVAQKFNSSLQAQLGKWRRDLGKVTVYPMFSYSVVYSFNIR